MGQQIKFRDYPEARGALIERLGQYCSYCETRLNASLAVEHVRPKRPPTAREDDQERALDWNNFLLACTNCNATKGNKDVVLDDYVWPDRDNTFRAIEYDVGGVVREHSGAGPGLRQKARAMIKLVGLNTTPMNDVRASDRRWLNRREAWDVAQASRTDLNTCDTEPMRRQFVRTAVAKGFWSVWMTVFHDDPDMLRRFIDAFAGTCVDCFDLRGARHSLHRHGGVC